MHEVNVHWLQFQLNFHWLMKLSDLEWVCTRSGDRKHHPSKPGWNHDVPSTAMIWCQKMNSMFRRIKVASDQHLQREKYRRRFCKERQIRIIMAVNRSPKNSVSVQADWLCQSLLPVFKHVWPHTVLNCVSLVTQWTRQTLILRDIHSTFTSQLFFNHDQTLRKEDRQHSMLKCLNLLTAMLLSTW